MIAALLTVLDAGTRCSRYQLRIARCRYKPVTSTASSGGGSSRTPANVHTDVMLMCGVLDTRRRIRSTRRPVSDCSTPSASSTPRIATVRRSTSIGDGRSVSTTASVSLTR